MRSQRLFKEKKTGYVFKKCFSRVCRIKRRILVSEVTFKIIIAPTRQEAGRKRKNEKLLYQNSNIWDRHTAHH